ncbi:MAG: nucleotide exchange factor GrpE [Selenomonadaceae bacterium]|nr:nucleotide exchange factor GrpE [Selenomonadaceae bacterium]
MQREIDEAAVEQANDSEPEAETAAATESAEAKEAAENEEKDEAQEAEDPVAKLTAELKETENALKRLRADFENYRRRTTKEKEEIGAVVNQEIIKEMLPLLDNFERALSTDGQNSEKFREGVEMICKQFVEILKKNGLEPIETQGAVFDPNFHQAVMRVENPDLADDTIAAELQKGYMVKGKVIRPSMVQVVANN